MKIWITRHGQTKLNKEHLMQGRTDEPLNETGFSQAKAARKMIGDVTFDAVYASPLRRAVDTAVIIGNVPEKDVIIDPRLIEVDFGKYELRPYLHLGLPMFLFWAMPGIFPAPKTVEPISSLVSPGRHRERGAGASLREYPDCLPRRDDARTLRLHA